jgi:hypothetical protein
MTGPDLEERVRAGFRAALDRVQVQARPFAHFALEGALPADVHEEALARLPGDDLYRADNPDKYRLPGGQVARGTLALDDPGLAASGHGPFWAAVSGALRAPEVRERVLALLARDLCRRFRVPPARLSGVPAFPSALLVRDRPGYFIEPHPDSPAKVATVQVYLPRDSSQAFLGTSLYRLRPWNVRNWLATGRPLQEFHRFPFVPGGGYGFAVGAFSWHGVERIPEGAGVRDSLMLVYYRDEKRARG